LKNGSTVGIPSPPAILMPNGHVIKPDIRDAECLQGFDADWTVAAPERLRWSLVGNAVSVPVAAWLGKRLKRPGRYDVARDRLWPTKVGSFPRAARYDGTRRLAVEIGDFPQWTKREPLHLFLRHQGTPLSARATAGFLSRAEASSLRFVPGFLEAVRSHLGQMRRDEARKIDARESRSSPQKTRASILMAAE
jgi:DNA (cytosine-5)-methyltransferase 1